MFGTCLAISDRQSADRQHSCIRRGTCAFIPAGLDHRACDTSGWTSRSQQLHVSTPSGLSVGRPSRGGLLGTRCAGRMDTATVSEDPHPQFPVLRWRPRGRDRHPCLPRRRRRAAFALPDRSSHWTQRLRSLRHQPDVSLTSRASRPTSRRPMPSCSKRMGLTRLR